MIQVNKKKILISGLNSLSFIFVTGASVIQKPIFNSGGFVLGSSSVNSPPNTTPLENIRNIWANKFNDKKDESDENAVHHTHKTKVTEATSAWEEIDDDILIHSVQNTVIEIDDGSNDGFGAAAVETVIQPTNETKLKISIKKELLDDLGEDDANIEMIDDEFDDTLNESLDLLTDTTVIDEIFGIVQFIFFFPFVQKLTNKISLFKQVLTL